ncbi:SMC-Scp complex subunit ScpB [Paenarthrobacter sp. DKR-5]|uniref:SMC-Scp complex subunit ScpB n=1 Tax=Paenarthrobacter sp. DKR-5 TaxID=2835535 RepID=UPI001BDC0408|nr:SMC-Scp complex subunit ScpB [Paenarthrobacter sp. DKR-5]MBT1002189.1 SMC-Scp complex subunit ScpB [Paenarthrobacter sp. DKR-5]
MSAQTEPEGPPEEPSADTGVEGLPGGAAAALEAVLMVVDEPVTAIQLATTLMLPVGRVEELLLELAREYDGYTNWGPVRPRGFELRSVAGGWRFYSRTDFAPVVSSFVLEGQTARLTQAAMETLAVIAYRQPVSRARVSAIRGVNVDSVVRTLTQRALIEEAGHDPESGAILYRTTSYFLERLGIGTVEELPKLAPHLPGLENLGDFEEASY